MTHPVLRPFNGTGYSAGRGVRELGYALARIVAGLRASCEETNAAGLRLYVDQALKHLENAETDFRKASKVSDICDRENASTAADEIRTSRAQIAAGMAQFAPDDKMKAVRFLIESVYPLDEAYAALRDEPQSALLARAREVKRRTQTWKELVDVLRAR